MSETRWQQNQKVKKLKKDAAAAALVREKASKAVDDQNCRVLRTAGGATYMPMDVAGYGMCALLVIVALSMVFTGIPYAIVFAAANGVLTDEMKKECFK